MENAPSKRFMAMPRPNSTVTDVMSGYPQYNGNTRKQRQWYYQAKDLWREWGWKLNELERETWKREVKSLKLIPDAKSVFDHKFSHKGESMLWTHWTFLKIMFPLEYLIGTEVAVYAQMKFPEADITLWEPNTHGPTTDWRFVHARSGHTSRSIQQKQAKLAGTRTEERRTSDISIIERNEHRYDDLQQLPTYSYDAPSRKRKQRSDLDARDESRERSELQGEIDSLKRELGSAVRRIEELERRK
ncbi:hypothetical protein QQZ08_010196 [Neonectria magnoliae]|uniref:Uncharacterized protein n=1 Tax=Neonectria magnoliae TaxID=2732573 RepID=A0ABR1HI78_9HYPO